MQRRTLKEAESQIRDARRYRALRKSLGTQGVVAAQLGIAMNTISRRELGLQRIDKEAFLALRYLLSLSKSTTKGD